ncbi:unnamed protein product [Musa textilis]
MVTQLQAHSGHQRCPPHLHQLDRDPLPEKLTSISMNKAGRQCGRALQVVSAHPLLVVYIANPVRVTTSAATFRSLVQKLTGRDADTAELDTTSCSSPLEPADDASTASAPASVASPDSGGSVPSEPSTSGGVRPDNSLVAPVEVFEEGFDAQMMGSFPGFISSILCYEPRVAGIEGFTEV